MQNDAVRETLLLRKVGMMQSVFSPTLVRFHYDEKDRNGRKDI